MILKWDSTWKFRRSTSMKLHLFNLNNVSTTYYTGIT